MLKRSQGLPPGRVPGSLGDVPPALSRAYVDEPITWAGAVALTRALLDCHGDVAGHVLDAHARSGLRPEGHAALRRSR